MRLAWMRVAALLTVLLPALPALALQQDGTQSDLYQDALKSISEGRKADADDALRQLIARAPLHAGAWLDLALIQCELGNEAEAERLFATIETRFDPPPGIQELINAAREQGCKKWRRQSSADLVLGRGSDQNVNQGASRATYLIDGATPVEVELTSAFRPQHDQFTQLNFGYQTDLTANGTRGFVDMRARRNDHLHDYDTASLFAGIETPWRLASWRLHTSAIVGTVGLGGRLYQRQGLLQARVDLPSPGAGTRLALLASAARSQYLTLQNFNSSIFELRTQLSRETAAAGAVATVAVLADRSAALRPGGARHGTQASVRGRHQLGANLDGELSYSREQWRSSSAYSPGLINQVRQQSTGIWRAALTYPVGPSQRLQLEARAIRNQENITIFQYNERVVQLSWQRQWR